MPYKDKNKQRDAVRKSVTKWRLANPELHRERVRARQHRVYREKRELVTAFKNAPCMDCGKKFPPEVMDFDHRVRSDKVMAVATMVGGGCGIKRLLEEIKKCDIVCANCHRIRTFGVGSVISDTSQGVR